MTPKQDVTLVYCKGCFEKYVTVSFKAACEAKSGYYCRKCLEWFETFVIFWEGEL